MYPERVDNDGQDPRNESTALPAPGPTASHGAAPGLRLLSQLIGRRPVRAVLLVAAVFAIPYSLVRHGGDAPAGSGAITADAPGEQVMSLPMASIAVIPASNQSRTSWDPPIGVDRTNEVLDGLTRDFSSCRSCSLLGGEPGDSQAPDSEDAPAEQPGPQISSLPPDAVQPAPTTTPGLGDHTAVYDIAARTVYLPDGHRLEAHSGLGSHLDDPRYVDRSGRGPTPPNVYTLVLRPRLFHGVRAIRLIPTDDGKMFGRNGILAHSYMLGPSGQSNGCVVFRNYPVFLSAFLRGEVHKLVVVDRLTTTTARKTSAASEGLDAASGG